MRKSCYWVLGAILLASRPAAAVPPVSEGLPPTLIYQGEAYVALPVLSDRFGLKSTPPKVAAQSIKVESGGRTWDFFNGGDQVRCPDGRIHPLFRPLLVFRGVNYLDRHDAQELLGVRVTETGVQSGDQEMKVAGVALDSPYQTHQVGELDCTASVWRLTGAVDAREDLFPGGRSHSLPAGGIYLCRREATVDGVRYALLTDMGATPDSYLVPEAVFAKNRAEVSAEQTAWRERMVWFRERAAGGQALQTGNRLRLAQRISVTMDFCWSMRPPETDFLAGLPALAHDVHPPVTVFLSGRWMEQHPGDMEALIRLQQQSGVRINWGLHSWVHPKAGGFMDDLTLADTRADTLRLERKMLEWGVVPTVYYRFPGLIHDAAHLTAILDMNLLPVDCEAWVAVQGEEHPFGHPMQSGSIVLVHGNGNEPNGIARFRVWLKTHPDWRWEPLGSFLP